MFVMCVVAEKTAGKCIQFIPLLLLNLFSVTVKLSDFVNVLISFFSFHSVL